jgi:hypothetical protein
MGILERKTVKFGDDFEDMSEEKGGKKTKDGNILQG